MSPSSRSELFGDQLFAARLEGAVTAFDSEVGTGKIALKDGHSVEFHCVEIADGTRTIEIGRRVICSLAGLNLGRVEAVAVYPCPT